MSFKVEVPSSETTTREIPGNDQRGPLTFHEQTAYIDLGGKYPERFKISHRKPSDAYQPGDYLLSPESVRIGRFDSPEFTRDIKLMPAKASATAKVA